MATRKTIQIDEEKCNGCALCVDVCPQSVLEIVDGKARVIAQPQCDELGFCIGECPEGAIRFETVEADAPAPRPAAAAPAAGGCPGSAPRALSGCPGARSQSFGPNPGDGADPSAEAPSALTHWPIQLKLMNPAGPAYQGADVLLAADCTAFTLGAFHKRLLAGRSLIIACPKLDDWGGYVEKLTALFHESAPRSVAVARMEVPCCMGIVQMLLDARQAAGSQVPIKEIVISLQGAILSERNLNAGETAPSAASPFF